MPDQNTKAISERLLKVAERLFHGNQADMSRAMGMSPQGMNPYFKAERKPGYKIIKRLVELGVNATWILSGIPPMMISDISQAGVDKLQDTDRRPLNNESAGEQAPDFFAHINQDQLSETERVLLEEVKHFSDSLKNYQLPLQVKRLMLQLMIEHIDQEIERLQNKNP